MDEKITVKPGTFERLKESGKPIHLVLMGTKPEIIKQAPLILKLRENRENLLIVHSGQHYDWNLSKGIEEEFDISPDINLNAIGKMHELQSQIIERFGNLICELKKINKKIIPYTYADTTTAVAGGMASYANKVGVAHVEAGLRTMSPPKEILMELLEDFDVINYYHKMKNKENWSRGSYEPYPEQFDSRASGPSASIHLAPIFLNKESLLNEGYDEKRIFVVGNPVVDTIKIAKKRIHESKVFEKFPKLKQGNFIRFCVHRRENVSSRHRFKVLIGAMEDLIKEGKNILFISLGGTEKALKEYGLKEKIEQLAETYKNFIYSGVWPSYIDVIAAMDCCSVIATDSGSIQEEANILGIPLVILRFNSDRPEAVFSGSGIIAPPIRKDIVHKIIKEVHENLELRKKMTETKNLYNSEVSEKITNAVNKLIEDDSMFSLFEHEIRGFTKLDFWEEGGMEW